MEPPDLKMPTILKTPYVTPHEHNLNNAIALIKCCSEIKLDNIEFRPRDAYYKIRCLSGPSQWRIDVVSIDTTFPIKEYVDIYQVNNDFTCKYHHTEVSDKFPK